MTLFNYIWNNNRTMKRILSLVFVYVTSISGATLNVHFCGGSLENISIAGVGHEGCCCGAKKMDSNCCKDKHITFECKEKHERLENYIISSPLQQSLSIDLYQLLLYENYPNSYIRIVNIDHHPARGEGPDLVILNRNLRI